ncbi:842_t:CDS:2 [Dentiscutata erythropus]|uniref:842_t:CDS:1 n=1 Tax=Dentiscutata erythropus TaxID=1348616 RepID=A0A9N8YZ51_9GLOM|nr:842_t:CDS:2 [Dentiscutata erythropus]
MGKPFLKLLFFITCLIPTISARLTLPQMFNFELNEYIPYMIVTAILVIFIIPIREFRIIRGIIFGALSAFLVIIFPTIFFYMTEGFSKKTIVFMIFTIVESIGIIFVGLIYLVSFKNCCRRENNWENIGAIFKTGFDIRIHAPYIVSGVIIGGCVKCSQGRIISIVLVGIDHYITFYFTLDEVNRVSLLLFWLDLWFILFGIYTMIEIFDNIETREVKKNETGVNSVENGLHFLLPMLFRSKKRSTQFDPCDDKQPLLDVVFSLDPLVPAQELFVSAEKTSNFISPQREPAQSYCEGCEERMDVLRYDAIIL